MVDLQELLRSSVPADADIDGAGVVEQGFARRRRTRLVTAVSLVGSLFLAGAIVLTTGSSSNDAVTFAGEGNEGSAEAELPEEEGAPLPEQSADPTTVPSEVPTDPGGVSGAVEADDERTMSTAVPHQEGPVQPVAEDASFVRYTDDAGDVETSIWALPGTTRPSEPNLDLRAVGVQGEASVLRIVVEVEDLDEQGPRGANGAQYKTSFRLTDDAGGVDLAVHLDLYNSTQGVRFMTSDGPVGCPECDAVLEYEANLLVIVVPLDQLDGALSRVRGEPMRGDVTLDGFTTTSTWVHTEQRADGTDCDDPTDRTGCRPGPFAAADADSARGAHSLVLRPL